MPKKAKELSSLSVKRIARQGLHPVGGVAGLRLQVKGVAKSWILKISIGGKRREIGLGRFPDISLAGARDKARGIVEQVAKGIDPVQQKKQIRSRLIAERTAEITFKQAANEFLADRGVEWRNVKHAQQWTNTLIRYVYPVVGDMQIKDVELSHIIKILEPIWTTKTETASRLRGRVESVLDWATVRGYRKGDNPARWKGYLDKILPSPSKISKTVHYKALPVSGVKTFMEKLRESHGVSARALEFLVLTATRSGEIRGAIWSEIDLKGRVWTIPAERMKAGKEHRVPLSKRAIQILKSLPRFKDVDFVFPSPRGNILSDMALNAVLRRMGIDVVPHGFRSTFRDWVAEKTNYPNEVAEMALAHTIGNKVEAAYRRGDLFEKRRKMMDNWTLFCTTKSKKKK